ncbi:hypothetical protein [Mycoplana rhizolycopersici]|jgi:hypothetical protein|uniref:Uncharacterized protein n=1 Tax=Mycoplana rhizolycopersici TaxID=2746702 RepID=A0ABX2Q9L1_9HYPH|nr:hypothetical protein [Rhizobium rhizolycopersici]NVP53996.1 hypothetical protein [Rhizobium rhizolycopersici]
MHSIRSIFVATLAVVIAGVTLVFAASLGLALAGIASVIMFGSWIAAKMQPAPVRARCYARTGKPGQREPRIWNDGRGTIIDL